jgi:DNA-directed RNA polymerase specialized sigma24 family protein
MDAEPVEVELIGDPVADGFASFYRREHDAQVRRAFLLVGDSSTAHRVVADAFGGVLAHWDRIDDPVPHLSRSVVEGCRGARRGRSRGSRRPEPTAGGADDGSADPVDELADRLLRLPFRQRAAVVLWYHDGLSLTETAHQLGCRSGSAGSSVHRALDSLHATSGRQLADRLDQRADRIEVIPALERLAASVSDAHPLSDQGSFGPFGLVLGGVAAAVLAVAVAAASVMTGDGATPIEAAGGAPGLVGTTEVTVWLDSRLTWLDVEAIDWALRDIGLVQQVAYLGSEAASEEVPESGAAPSGAQGPASADWLPTSFQVTTTDPVAVAWLVEALPGVSWVDHLADSGSDGALDREPPEGWMIVWMAGGATARQLAAVDEALDGADAATDHVGFGTGFRVVTDDPEAVWRLLDGLAGVGTIEIGRLD